MKNKLIALGMLLFVFWGIWGVYMYFFVWNTGNIIFLSNVEWYKVTFYSETIKIPFQTTCENIKCELIELAPFEYEVTLSKSWYKDMVMPVKVHSRGTQEIQVYLEREVTLLSAPPKEIDPQEKLTQLRDIASLSDVYEYIVIPGIGVVYFEDNGDDTLSIWQKAWELNRHIYRISKVSRNHIRSDRIYQVEDAFVLFLPGTIYIFDLHKWVSQKLFFEQKVDYVKKSPLWYHLFVKWEGNYIYTPEDGKVVFFDALYDFVVFDDERYLWIIWNDFWAKKEKYGIEDHWDILVWYDVWDDSVEILDTLEYVPQMIYLEDGEVYGWDSAWWKIIINGYQ